MKNLISLILLCILFIQCSNDNSGKVKNSSTAQTSLSDSAETPQLIPIHSQLTAPVFLTHAFDDRLFIVEQAGIIRISKNGKLIEDPFLDISNKVEAGKGYSEKGLLGLAFHPEYKNNGRFFIYYSAPYKKDGSNHKSILAEYRVSKENPDKAAMMEKVIMEIPEPESNHNGGMLAFGPDGYLYVGLGDGGGAGDHHGKKGNAQDKSSLLGKILRIDINEGDPYSIPGDNPFLNEEGVREEIFALGLRNPWRFSFDSQTGEFFCGDVGQNTWEEIDIIEKGNNYGWRVYEGPDIFNKDESLMNRTLIAPIHYYPRSVGTCIIGGYVYRGKSKDYQGKYFFADWNGKVFYLEKNGKEWNRQLVHTGDYIINSLGEDNKGNLYVLVQQETGPQSQTGTIFKLEIKP